MNFEYLIYPVCIFLIGILASFINIMAGGGSVLTLGVLMLFGLDASVANGTNRFGIIVESISGISAYKSEQYSNIKESILLAIFTLPGAVIGSIYAIQISSLTFQRILAVVMIFIIVTLFIPQKNNNKTAITKMGKILVYPAMLIVGFYGGFIQAGVGFLIIASLRHLLKLDLVLVNMHKVYIILIYTIPLLFIFGFTGNIHWIYALCLAAGNAVGAWISVKVSIKKGEKIIKTVFIAAILIMSIKFLLAT